MAAPEQFFHPLAIDKDGKGFSLPKEATGWRIQRASRRQGRAETLYDADDKVLEIPIDSRPEDLRAALVGARLQAWGKFRLLPCDRQGVPVLGSICASAQLRPPEGEQDESSAPDEGGDRGESSETTSRMLAASLEKIVDKMLERDTAAVQALAQAVRDMSQAMSQTNQRLAQGYARVRPVVLDASGEAEGRNDDDDGEEDDGQDGGPQPEPWTPEAIERMTHKVDSILDKGADLFRNVGAALPMVMQMFQQQAQAQTTTRNEAPPPPSCASASEANGHHQNGHNGSVK